MAARIVSKQERQQRPPHRKPINQSYSVQPARTLVAHQFVHKTVTLGNAVRFRPTKQTVRDNEPATLPPTASTVHADQMRTHSVTGNPLRLRLTTLALFLVEQLLAVSIRGVELINSMAQTIRVMFLKVGMAVKGSARPSRRSSACTAGAKREIYFAACQPRLRTAATHEVPNFGVQFF